jgi:hypothetical protein
LALDSESRPHTHMYSYRILLRQAHIESYSTRPYHLGAGHLILPSHPILCPQHQTAGKCGVFGPLCRAAQDADVGAPPCRQSSLRSDHRGATPPPCHSQRQIMLAAPGNGWLKEFAIVPYSSLPACISCCVSRSSLHPLSSEAIAWPGI